MSVDSLLAYAKSQVGYVEKPVNKNKYGRQFGADGLLWCMQFVWACFENSGNHGLVPKTASTRDLFQQAKAGRLAMRWLPKTATPRPGDLVEFDMGGPKPVNHVGIVQEVHGARILCIEGNTGGKGPNGERNGGMVARKNRDLSRVVNFVRVAFPDAPAASTATPAPQAQPPKFPGRIIAFGGQNDPATVRQIQARLNVVYKGRIAANGNKPFRGTGVYGEITRDTIVDFQRRNGLEADGKVGKNTWAKLFG